MLSALANWPSRPTTAQGEVHAILGPIIDDLAGGGATVTHVEVWPNEIDKPTVVHFMVTVTAHRLRGSNRREYAELVERLTAMGFKVAPREPGDTTDNDFHVLASAPVDPATKRLKASGALPRTRGATDDLGGIVKTVDQLKREYDLHHLHPSRPE